MGNYPQARSAYLMPVAVFIPEERRDRLSPPGRQCSGIVRRHIVQDELVQRLK
jgi:hypothetical protein